MSIRWTRVVLLVLVLVVAALVAWETVGLDGELSLVPSDMLRAARVFCVEWAAWLGSYVYTIVDWLYENIWWVFRRIGRAVTNLVGESFSFLEVPYAFVCAALGNAYKWAETSIFQCCMDMPFWMDILMSAIVGGFVMLFLVALVVVARAIIALTRPPR